MAIRGTARDRAAFSSLFADETEFAGRAADFRRGEVVPEDLQSGPGGVTRQSPPISEILRDSDLDALLHGLTGSDFLNDRWFGDLPVDRMVEVTHPFTDFRVEADKDADTALVLPGAPGDAFLSKDSDIAQVLPGVTADDFLLSKDVDLPLVLPGEEDGGLGLLTPDEGLDVHRGFPTHMLTLDGEGGFEGGTDDIGRLHDHDGWLF